MALGHVVLVADCARLDRGDRERQLARDLGDRSGDDAVDDRVPVVDGAPPRRLVGDEALQVGDPTLGGRSVRLDIAGRRVEPGGERKG
jgi:hypothetical protein